jgi:hypothetical protein
MHDSDRCSSELTASLNCTSVSHKYSDIRLQFYGLITTEGAAFASKSGCPEPDVADSPGGHVFSAPNPALLS